MSKPAINQDDLYNRERAAGSDGFGRLREPKNGRFQEAVISAAELLLDTQTGRAADWMIKEAIQPRTPYAHQLIEANYPHLFNVSESGTTSNFPNLTGHVLNRLLLADYAEWPKSWQAYTHTPPPLKDFRSVERYVLTHGDEEYEATPEEDEVKGTMVREVTHTYKPAKYTKSAGVSFEAVMNDDLEALTSIPKRLGIGGALTIERAVTQLLCDANGPHAAFITGANLLTASLSVASLQAAVDQLAKQVTESGRPIYIRNMVLVVPPQLEVTAMNILNAIEIRPQTSGGSNAAQQIIAQNWMKSRFTHAINPYIPLIATANPNSWFVVANTVGGRYALEIGFVRGMQEPALYTKQAEAVRVGGGLDQSAGSWDTMSQQYKGVIAFGTLQFDSRLVVGSNSTT